MLQPLHYISAVGTLSIGGVRYRHVALAPHAGRIVRVVAVAEDVHVVLDDEPLVTLCPNDRIS